jgi:predicted permease
LAVSIDGQAVTVAGGMLASGNYFATMRIPFAAGRPLDANNDRVDAPPAAVISHAFAVRGFGSAEAALGHTLIIHDTLYTIVGVTGTEFTGLSAGGLFPATDITLPLSAQPVVVPRWSEDGASMFTTANRFWIRVMARLKPGSSAAALQQLLSPVFSRGVFSANLLAPEFNGTPSVRVISGARGLDSSRRDNDIPLYLLAGVSALVLIITCMNLASLTLAKNVARSREIALRQAIGASRFRVVSQLLLESLALAFAGAAGGIFLSLWAGPLINSMLTAGIGTVATRFSVGWKTLVITAIIAFGSALLFGLLPALRLTLRQDLNLQLGNRVLGAATPRLTIGRVLIAIQVAVSIPLLVGAGLFLKTIHNLGAVELGFNPTNLTFFRIDPTSVSNDPQAHAQDYLRALERFEAIPGVVAATLIENPLMSGVMSNTNVTVGDQHGMMMKNAIGPRFFETMGMRLIAGRALGLQDSAGAPRAVVINEAAARKYFSRSPIGQRLRYGSRDDEVVGVVEDSKYATLRRDAEPTFYDAFLQRGMGPGSLYVVLRSSLPVAKLELAVRRAVAEVDPGIPITDFRTQTEQIDISTGKERTFTQLLVLFGVLALLLAGIGLHGVTSYSVSRRTGEIGIRLALGAQRWQVLWLVLRQIITLACLGVAVGVPLALATGPSVRSFLYGVGPGDVFTILACACLMFAVALFAGYLPARRASRTGILDALRQE